MIHYNRAPVIKCYVILYKREYSTIASDADSTVYEEDIIGYTAELSVVRWLVRNATTIISIIEYPSIFDAEKDLEIADRYDYRIFSHKLDGVYNDDGDFLHPIFEDDDVCIDVAYDDFLYDVNKLKNLNICVSAFVKDGILKDAIMEVLLFISDIMSDIDRSSREPSYTYDGSDGYFDANMIIARYLSSEEGREAYFFGDY